MERTDIMIIGGGICGLYAARELLNQGKQILILEGRSRLGGRIYSIKRNYSQVTESGAEFIHGEAPLTLALIKEARATLNEVTGDIYRSSSGQVFRSKDFIPGLHRVICKMNELEEDTTLHHFLQTHFTGPEDQELRQGIIRQAEGFDAAHPERISVFALRKEWSGSSMDKMQTIKEGYSVLVDKLTEDVMQAGAEILLSKIVKHIRWSRGNVMVTSADGSVYEASQVIVTVPLGVFTAAPGAEAEIEFEPEIPIYREAAMLMGYGPVVKIVFGFRHAFWNEEGFRYQCAQMPDLGFLLNDTVIPIFWSFSNDEEHRITGWAGGTQAEQLMNISDEELFDIAVTALGSALVCTEDLVMEMMDFHYVFNWGMDYFSKGAYSYDTPESPPAKALLRTPIENTLFFAGEALGDTSGTVEAALESGRDVVKRIMKQ